MVTGAFQRGNNGKRLFLRLWLGQMISLIGSGLTQFAIDIWVYRSTHSVSKFTLVAVFNTLPGLALCPLAGAISDKIDRWKVMLYSNVMASVTTLGIAAAGRYPAMWQLYTGVTVLSICSTFLNLAYTPIVSVLVPKEDYGRASGMMQSAQAAAWIIPPLIGGVLISFLSLPKIVLMDFASYIVAIVTLFIARIIPVEKRHDPQRATRTWLSEAGEGWSYITKRRGLQALLLYFSLMNLIMGVAQVLYTPLVLTISSPIAVGVVSAVSGGGFLLGGVAMSLWGGPRRRTLGMLSFGSLLAIGVLVGGFPPSVILISLSAFLMLLFLPVINGCSQAVWQSKTPIDLQGRVFSIRYMIGLSTAPLSYLLAGPLVEKVFAPLTGPGRALHGLLQPPAESIRLIFLLSGFLLILLQIGNYLYPRFRQLEDDLPDAVPNAAYANAD